MKWMQPADRSPWWLVAAVTLLFVIGGVSVGVIPTLWLREEEAGGDQSYQTARGNQRGPESGPAAAQLVNSGQDDSEATTEADRVKHKATLDSWTAEWTVRLTGVLVAATCLQFLAMAYQSYLLRRTVAISERALVGLERPLLHVVVESTNWDAYSSWRSFFAAGHGGHPSVPRITYSIRNYGRMPAVITNIAMGADYGRDEPDLATAVAAQLPRDHVIPAGGSTAPVVLAPLREIPTDIVEGRYDRQIIRFWWFGIIGYRSPGKNAVLFETEILWSYTPVEPISTFRPYLVSGRNRNT